MPLGGNPIAVKCIISYHIISFPQAACKRLPPFCGNIILLVEADGRELTLY